jgi:hypothetical protein
MSYIEDICSPLIKVLEKTAQLPCHQLAGHVANLDFWMNEVEHCLGVVSGYDERFERMKEALQTQAAIEGIEPNLLQRGVKFKTGKDLQKQLRAATSRFLQRCHDERLINDQTLQAYQEKLLS